MVKIKKLEITLILLIVIFSIYGCAEKKEEVVNKEVIEQLLRDIYTPESLDYFFEAKQKYIDKGLITEDLANAMFTVADGVTELSEKDLARKLSIDSIQYSESSNNSVKVDLYKVTLSLKYDGNTTRAEIVFSVNTDGKLSKRDTNILSK